MCGFAGYFCPVKGPWPESVLYEMGETLVHRGPDDAGVWVDETAGLGLTHRRLAVQDLSSAGHQPMKSSSGRYMLVYNGEIYNQQELRKELNQFSTKGWRGHSDTETLLEAIQQWGLSRTLKKCIGMFAFALWDRAEKSLFLARDRMGEKPLYYGYQKGVFLFGSELKALKRHPAFEGGVSRDALTLFLRHNYIPSPYSIYTNVHKLVPGTVLQIRLEDAISKKLNTPHPYWSLKEIAGNGSTDSFEGTAKEAAQHLEDQLLQAVGRQMISDVPLGAFLSGGIDSSMVVAMMQAQSQQRVKTFTIGFSESRYNEAQHGKVVARHLKTDHTELYVSPQQAIEVIPDIPDYYDEPFSDSSQIPTYLLSKLTRNNVTVSLSGDGGDELFAGYNRYIWGRRIEKYTGFLPAQAIVIAANGVQKISPAGWDKLYKMVRPALPSRFRQKMFGDRVHKLADVLGNSTRSGLYHRLVSHWHEPEKLVIDGHEPATLMADLENWPDKGDCTEQMMLMDSLTYLPDDILTKVDRAAMAVSLETRLPYLDHTLIEFAWRLPTDLKIRRGETKWLLRQVLYKYVPKELIERPKMGFILPMDSWLRGPLRDWAEELLSSKKIEEEGFFRPGPIRQKWREHLSGCRNWQYHLWDILMFQAWREKQ